MTKEDLSYAFPYLKAEKIVHKDDVFHIKLEDQLPPTTCYELPIITFKDQGIHI